MEVEEAIMRARETHEAISLIEDTKTHTMGHMRFITPIQIVI